MNISSLCYTGDVFINREYVKGCAFKNAAPCVKLIISRAICSILGELWDNYVHFYRVEYLLPHISAA